MFRFGRVKSGAFDREDYRDASDDQLVDRKGTFGEIIWLFDEGKLTRLRTLESGGRRVTLTFKRTPTGITCAIDALFAREQGAGNLQTTAVGGGGKIKLLSMKQASTTCRVEKAP
jgi:hypothetical protein